MSSENKHWASWVLDVVVGIGAVAQIFIGIILIWQLKAYEASNELTRESVLLSSKNLDASTAGLELTRQSIVLGQKSLDLTQKSLESTQQALKLSQAANDISAQGIGASNTPWIDAKIDDISYIPDHPDKPELDDLPPNNGILGYGDAAGHYFSNKAIAIHYTLENHSDTPAKHVYVSFFLKNSKGYATGYVDTGAFGGMYNVAVMPKQTVHLTTHLIPQGGDPRDMIRLINKTKVSVEVYIFYFDALKHKTEFIETLHKLGDDWTVTGTEYDPPESEIHDMIYEIDTSKKSKK